LTDDNAARGSLYSDAVVEAFLERVDKRVAERVDREIAARIDARLASAPRAEPATAPPTAPSGHRATLLTGVAIGMLLTGLPSVLVAASTGGYLAKDEVAVLFVIGVLVALVAAITAWRATARQLRGRDASTRRA